MGGGLQNNQTIETEAFNYESFLRKKLIEHEKCGFEVDVKNIHPMLFDWQKVVTKWAAGLGKAALFESCGLGKTIQQIEWARLVHEKTKEDIIVIAPLAVSYQTIREAEKIGILVNPCKTKADIKRGINITNYERIDAFDMSRFIGVVLDESGILKGFTSKTKIALMEAFYRTPFKLCCTATPSPNDHMELLNHAEFLNIMRSNEALARWFINDTMQFGSYRIKKHAAKDFWRWVSSWAVCINVPSDIGYSDEGYLLPSLNTHKVIIDTPDHDYKNGKLFSDVSVEGLNATTLYRELRETAQQRCERAAQLVNGHDDYWIVWCNMNYEADLLAKLIPGAVNVYGSMKSRGKEEQLKKFANGETRVLVSKPSLAGFGLNLQHVNQVAFVGLSYSFEQRYQAIRRCWRFGQEREVDEYIVLSPVEEQVYKVIQKKEGKHEEMQRNMVTNISGYSDLAPKKQHVITSYTREDAKGENWHLIYGDAIREIKTIPGNSIHLGLHSPPFSQLYIYSDSIADMGNCKDDDEFLEHYGFLAPELYRVTIPGRLCVIHCKDLVNYKNNSGRAGLRDFPGKIIQLFESHGWQYHSRVTIWKDPVIEMQRTKSQGLLHAQIKRDTSMSRQGLPDYLIVFRKWPETGETSGPEPIIRPEGFDAFVGDNVPVSENANCGKETYLFAWDEKAKCWVLTQKNEGDEIGSIHVWQRYASPVWFDVQQTDVLNCRAARISEDEKHICPLQMPIVRRVVHLWSNPGDVVFSPFAGIGSEIYGAIEMGRKGLGIELKKSYFDYAKENLLQLEIKMRQKQLKLFA